MNIGAYIGYAVGVGGIVLTVIQYWTERRRARPVVITNEVENRTIKEGPKVTVTNDSTVPAFNVRYGVNVMGIYVPWKHSQKDREASRLNVLPAGETEPKTGPREIVIPDTVLFGFAPSLSTSGETLTIEESMTLRARTENAGHGDEHEWSWGSG